MAATPDNEPRNKAGLKIKYDVRKVHDPTGKHEDCDYFVLDPLHDDIALRVLTLYADLTPDDVLSMELSSWLSEVRLERVRVKYQVQELTDRLTEGQADRILSEVFPSKPVIHTDVEELRRLTEEGPAEGTQGDNGLEAWGYPTNT